MKPESSLLSANQSVSQAAEGEEFLAFLTVLAWFLARCELMEAYEADLDAGDASTAGDIVDFERHSQDLLIWDGGWLDQHQEQKW